MHIHAGDYYAVGGAGSTTSVERLAPATMLWVTLPQTLAAAANYARAMSVM